MIETYDKLPDDIIFKNVVILMTCIIKDGDKLYSQLFLGELFLSQNEWDVVKIFIRNWWRVVKSGKSW